MDQAQLHPITLISNFIPNTVRPLLSGHPQGTGKWPLNRGLYQKLAICVHRVITRESLKIQHEVTKKSPQDGNKCLFNCLFICHTRRGGPLIWVLFILLC